MSLSRFPRTLLRWALSILALALLFGVAAWLLLPRWLAGPGMRMASEALGREVRVAEVRFQPWRLALELDGLRVAGRQPADAPLLTVAQVQTAVSLRSLWHLSPVLSELAITQPVLRLARLSDGHYDVDDLLARFAAQPAAKPDDAPPRIGLYNIRLDGGQILLDDRPVGRQHALTELKLALPFLSTLSADVSIAVKPLLSGRLNGVAFGSEAQLLPFAAAPQAQLDFKVDDLDLAPYLGYLPADLPLRMQRGRVDARLKLRFDQAPKQAPQLTLGGDLTLSDFALRTPTDQPWLQAHELRVALKDVQPLRRQARFGAIGLDGLQLALRTDAGGRLWLPVAASEADGKAPMSSPWTVAFDRFDLKAAQIDLEDASQPRPAALQAQQLQVAVGAFAWPLQPQAATPLSWQFQLVAGKGKPAPLQGEGSLAVEQLLLNVAWQDLSLGDFAPWLQAQAPVSLTGRFGGKAALTLPRPLDAEPMQRAALKLEDLRVAGLAIAPASGSPQPPLSAASLHLDQLSLDFGGHQLSAGELLIDKPSVQAQRTADGRWNYEAMMPAETATANATASASAPPVPDAVAWRASLQQLKLAQGRARLQDAGQAGAAVVQADQIELRLQDLAWPLAAAPVPVQLSLNLARERPAGAEAREPRKAAAARAPGKLSWRGQILPASLGASGKLQAEALPLQLIDAYLDPAWGVQLRRAELGLKGEFTVAKQGSAGWQASWNGDAQLGRVRLNQAHWQDGQRVVGNELVGWQTLALSGLSLMSRPGEPPTVTLARASLDDYYMQLNVDEQGNLNISDLGGRGQAAAPPAGAASGIVVVAAPSSAPAGSAAAPALLLTVGEIRFSKGEVDFSDRFIRPNYSAHLTELEGSLGAFATAKPAMAPLSLRGKVQGTGDLLVEGQMNPVGVPLTLDIKARATDIELTPLSPYSAKYAGYAIERGKLSTQVEYKIDEAGQLQASNRITLNQLTFGDRVDSPDATSLPVRLAVALLTDSNGVIDVDLPISGSVNDPDFSVGGLVLQVIGNLLKKAITAPFALFSGGSSNADISHAPFAPGLAVSASPEQLDKVAKMLGERPGLALTITGWADAGVDSPALLQGLAEAGNARRRRPAAAKPAAAAASAPATASAEQLFGLADSRATAVRDALIARGIANSRLFIGAPRLTDGVDKAWQPHAELSLDVR